MNLLEKNITLTGIDLLNFSGINEENLEIIKENFDSTIVFRGDTIFLKGEETEIRDIEKVINGFGYIDRFKTIPNDLAQKQTLIASTPVVKKILDYKNI